MFDFSMYGPYIDVALKCDKITPRASGSNGVWVCFLLPLSVLTGALRVGHVTHFYVGSCAYSIHTLLNAVLLLYHLTIFKSIRVIENFNLLCVVPTVIGLYLYTEVVGFDYAKGFCFASLNCLTYFEALYFFLKTFPGAFTFGEANIAAQAVSFFIFNLFLQLHYLALIGIPIFEYEISTAILSFAISLVLGICSLASSRKLFSNVIVVYVMIILSCVLLNYLVRKFVHINLIFWVWKFITKPERLGLILIWAICSVTAIVIVIIQINRKRKGNTILRKYFHVLAVVVFLSGILLDTNLIYFSSGCVFGLFLLLELFRILKLPPFYEFLQKGFLVYKDEKDSGRLAVSPISLLIGVSLPLWIHPMKTYTRENYLELLSGVLSVGIGDTFASVGGKIFGRHYWAGSPKTLEGTMFSILSQMLAIQILVVYRFVLNTMKVFLRTTIAIILTSLLEAKTDQIDNIVLPFTMYFLLMLL